MTEFKGALEYIVKVKDIEDNEDAWKSIAILVSSDISTITKALRIADRLMGDWNEEMYVAFMNEFNPYQPMTESFDAGIKAMRDQILKEIEQEQHH